MCPNTSFFFCNLQLPFAKTWGANDVTTCLEGGFCSCEFESHEGVVVREAGAQVRDKSRCVLYLGGCGNKSTHPLVILQRKNCMPTLT